LGRETGCILFEDDTPVGIVAFVTDQDAAYFIAVLIDFVKPSEKIC
jgi:hypothetical protein